MKKAAIYMRVSTSRQEEEQTIEIQEAELKERIEKDGNILVPNCTYADNGWTGALLKRPDLDRLRTDARDHLFDVLYFFDRGRLARLYHHQEIVLEELHGLGVETISLHDVNGMSPEERMLAGVMGIFHEFERTKITERMRIGKLHKVKENKKLLGYNAKYGYTYHERIKTGPNARDGYFSINKEQAEHVRFIFNLYHDGKSIYEIRKILFEHKIYPPKAKRTYWATSTLRRLLSDSTYAGKHFYNKTRAVETKNPTKVDTEYQRVAKGSRTPRPQDEWLPIDVPKIIDEKLFNSVQNMRALRKRTNTRNNKRHNYLVAGLVNCVCGKPRTGDPANGHYYYRCTDRLAHSPEPRTCFEYGVNADVLDHLVWNTIKDHLMNPQLLLKQAERWLQDPSPTNDQMDTLKKCLRKFDEEERRLAKAYSTGLMSEATWKANQVELRDTRLQAATKYNALLDERTNRPQLTAQQLVDATPVLLQDFNFTEKKAIIQRIVTKIEATKKEVTLWGHLPVNTSKEVGFEPFHRHRRPAKCRQINPVQRPDE